MRFLTEADCGRTGVEACPFARDAVPDDYPYALVFPNDGSTVRTEDIISFYRKIRSKEPDKGKLADAIRQFAREHVSMEAVMEPIADYIGK